MNRRDHINRQAHAGFTLIELVIVIIVVAALSSLVAGFITRPVEGYISLGQRATLVYTAENALRRMQRDIRRALPNSVRVRDSVGTLNNITCTSGGGTDCSIEMISTLDGARYRRYPPGQVLDTTSVAVNSSFELLGRLENNPNPAAVNYVSIYNIGATTAGGAPVQGANAYTADVLPPALSSNVISPQGTAIALNASLDVISLTFPAAFRFRFQSPQQRVFLVDTPVSYVCSGGQLTRYSGYNISTAHNIPPAGAAALMADKLARCEFIYQPGTSQRAGLLTLALTVQHPRSGESVRLLHQVHVDNVP
jgi:MSHA biogenesis protein MshO